MVELKKLLLRKSGIRAGIRKTKVKRLNKRQQGMRAAFVFLARLLLLSIPLYLVIGLGLGAAVIRPMQVAVAGQSAWLLERMGFHVTHDDVFIAAYTSPDRGPFSFMISQDCTGWKSMLFLFALIFAVPGVAMRRRLWGLVFGLPAIWLGNLARVAGVVLAERAYGAAAALVIHDYMWQLGLIALVLGIWLLWMLRIKTEKRKSIWDSMRAVPGLDKKHKSRSL